MKSKPLHILITDNKEHRRIVLCEHLRAHGQLYRYNFNSECFENEPQQLGMWKAVEQLPDFDLHLLHVGNYERHRDRARARHCILYGGYGQDDLRALKNEPLIRQRLDDHHALDADQVALLIAYVRGEIPPPKALLKVKTDPSHLVERRADFLDLLSMPTTFDWQQAPPGDLFADEPGAWEEFYTQARQLLDQFPNLQAGDPQYAQYAELLSQLHLRTIENKL
ncbi:MAG: hypothetical protein AAFW73_19010 [Bacteroidota bacterium]